MATLLTDTRLPLQDRFRGGALGGMSIALAVGGQPRLSLFLSSRILGAELLNK